MEQIIEGDCLEKLKELPENSVDAVVTDPPYGLSFMGKKWDYDVPSIEIWQECLRVLKPGGHLLSFGGTRTYHRMACAIEDAGFEIRDMVSWIYGSGFPKSLNIGKAVDKLQGNEREVVGEKRTPDGKTYAERRPNGDITGYKGNGQEKRENTQGIETKGNSQYEGWGTALKPALEPITVARKPLSEKTVAENCLKWGVGGINIDGCRVEYTSEQDKKEGQSARPSKTSNANDYSLNHGGLEGLDRSNRSDITGRFPANLCHDGSDEVVSLFPNTKGGTAVRHNSGGKTFGGDNEKPPMEDLGYGDSGSASRFFYSPKASKSERNKGCEGLEEKERVRQGLAGEKDNTFSKNSHPTVKPIALMEYLVKLVSRDNAVVLDPFAGSGSTGLACQNLKRNFILIEKEPEYIKIIKERLNGNRSSNQSS